MRWVMHLRLSFALDYLVAVAADEPTAFSIHDSLSVTRVITWPDLFQNQESAFYHVCNKPEITISPVKSVLCFTKSMTARADVSNHHSITSSTKGVLEQLGKFGIPKWYVFFPLNECADAAAEREERPIYVGTLERS
nr:hypothetical protein Iba_chr03aCG6450 [Ipomoea batatas]GMC73846.1 hypothetical protein Iba_chr03cCG4630 [Ipomoea batatas]